MTRSFFVFLTLLISFGFSQRQKDIEVGKVDFKAFQERLEKVVPKLTELPDELNSSLLAANKACKEQLIKLAINEERWVVRLGIAFWAYNIILIVVAIFMFLSFKRERVLKSWLAEKLHKSQNELKLKNPFDPNYKFSNIHNKILVGLLIFAIVVINYITLAV